MQYLYDETGRRYLDAFAGIVTVSIGHCHPVMVQAVGAEVQTRPWLESTTRFSKFDCVEKDITALPFNLKPLVLDVC